MKWGWGGNRILRHPTTPRVENPADSPQTRSCCGGRWVWSEGALHVVCQRAMRVGPLGCTLPPHPSSSALRCHVGRAPAAWMAAATHSLRPLARPAPQTGKPGRPLLSAPLLPLPSKSRVLATLEDPSGLVSLGPPQLTMMAAASKSHRWGSRRSRGCSSGTTPGAAVGAARALRLASAGQRAMSQE